MLPALLRRMRPLNEIGASAVGGIVAGLGATAVMSVAMLAARRAGLSGRLPPAKIAEEVVEEVTDRPPTDEEEQAVATISHFGFGAAAGAAFGVAAAVVRPASSLATTALGIAFASAVYLVSYQGWVPALGILPPASRDRRGRVATMVAAHWIYGAVLAIGTQRLTRAVRRR